MNKLTRILAAFLIALAVVLAGIAWWMGSRPPEPAPVAAAEPAPFHTLVITAVPIEKGKRIDSKDLKTIDSPRPVPGSYHAISHVAGRIAASDIPAEKLLTEGNLVQGIALQLADGERALALPVDEVIGVGHKLDPGDFVDVFVTLKPSTPIEKGHARLIASRLRVLAYGTEVIGTIDATDATTLRKPQGSSSAQPRTAVLATPVEEVNSLLLAVQHGKLALALRHPGDAGIANHALFPDSGIALLPRAGLSTEEKQHLLAPDNRAFAGLETTSWAGDKSKKTTPAKPSHAVTPSNNSPRTLEVIKGAQREQVRF
ncbi:Flp pilus assembly protein CpaB [uncultured Oxalicibacterium sp.]|uniref:Flp pilus assembly protein CpaB n=1 Tax=uncultured Oxalicibacterium sp. TaxID=1168540 RepID=UPI0025DC4D49|nr:Flp pilus assembly protein CpaB [uncultured Oxalicibacterium sp.]